MQSSDHTTGNKLEKALPIHLAARFNAHTEVLEMLEMILLIPRRPAIEPTAKRRKRHCSSQPENQQKSASNTEYSLEESMNDDRIGEALGTLLRPDISDFLEESCRVSSVLVNEYLIVFM